MSSSSSSSSSSETDEKFMSNFPPTLIHRILRTDPSDLQNLTVSGQPRDPHTPTFRRFVHDHGFLPDPPPPFSSSSYSSSSPSSPSSSPSRSTNNNDNDPAIRITQTLRRAFQDNLEQQLQSVKSYRPLYPTLRELHGIIRGLVPNRTDLHGLLNDDGDDVRSGSLEVPFEVYMQKLRKAGEYLSMLESEDRSIATKDWLRIFDSSVVASNRSAKEKREEEEEEETKEGTYTTTTTTTNEPQTQWDTHISTSLSIGTDNNATLSPIKFAIASTLYLHTKAEVCQQEILDFRLGHVLAPKIHVLGKPYLRTLFRKRFLSSNVGSSGGEEIERMTSLLRTMLPNTTAWITEMIEQSCVSSREDLLQSLEEKAAEVVMVTGWIDGVIFRKPRAVDADTDESGIGSSSNGDGRDSDGDTRESTTTTTTTTVTPPFLVPEVLINDLDSVSQIRTATKLSVVGSALALHASSVAGVGDAVLRREPKTATATTTTTTNNGDIKINNKNNDDVDEDEIGRRVEAQRVRLVRVMGNRAVGSREKYERDVGEVVLDLARAWNSTLSSSAEETILSRTSAVLRGNDPVLKLLDDRMRGVFRSLMLYTARIPDGRTVPVRLRTGLGCLDLSNDLVEGTTYDAMFEKAARREFTSKGFGFCAVELSEACRLAKRVIELVLDLFGNDVLIPLVLDECRRTR